MSASINDGGPAFPYAFDFPDADGSPGGINLGMTLRDYFAAKALTGIVDHVLFDQHLENLFVKDCPTVEARRAMAGKLDGFCAMLAYGVADAMLAERAKGRT